MLLIKKKFRGFFDIARDREAQFPSRLWGSSSALVLSPAVPGEYSQGFRFRYGSRTLVLSCHPDSLAEAEHAQPRYSLRLYPSILFILGFREIVATQSLTYPTPLPPSFFGDIIG